MANLKECSKCKEMINTRGFKTHFDYCKGTGEEDTNKDEKIIDQQTSTKECHVCKGKDIMRLDEYQLKSVKKFKVTELYSKGYTHVCTKCGEILK